MLPTAFDRVLSVFDRIHPANARRGHRALYARGRATVRHSSPLKNDQMLKFISRVVYPPGLFPTIINLTAGQTRSSTHFQRPACGKFSP